MNGEFDNSGVQQEVNLTGEQNGMNHPDPGTGSRFPAWLTEHNILTQLARKGRRGFVLPVEILIFFAVFIIAQILPAMFIGVFASMILTIGGGVESIEELNTLLEEGPAYVLINMAVCIMAILICFVFCLAIQRRPVQSMGFRGRDFVLQYVKGLFVGFVLFGAVIVIGMVKGAFRYVGVVDFAPATLLFYAIFFLIQGMQEEVLCRGYFMVSISRRSAQWVAVVVNAVVFAALHLLNPGINVLSIINLILFGVFASLYMLRTGNIWGVGAIHSIWNFAQGNLFGLPVSGLFTDDATLFDFEQTGSALLNGGEFGPEGGLIVTAVYVVGILIVLFFDKRR